MSKELVELLELLIQALPRTEDKVKAQALLKLAKCSQENALKNMVRATPSFW